MRVIETTSGRVSADSLGRILPHEHVFINELREDRAGGLLNDAAVMAVELRQFAEAGGGALVDLTTAGLTVGASPDPRGLYRGKPASGFAEYGTRSLNNVMALADLARATQVPIVLGTGQYRDPYIHADPVDSRGIDATAERMILDLTEGFPGTTIRAGVIGEVGADKWFVSALEERAIRAAGRAQRATGVAVTTHASKWPVGGDIMDLLRAESVPPERIIIGHCSTIDIPEYHLHLAQRGAYVQFDTLRGGPRHVEDRAVDHVMRLVRAGHISQLLLSHDVCLQSHLAQRGGCGYTYLFKTFVPLLAKAGLTNEEIDLMVISNPQRALSVET